MTWKCLSGLVVKNQFVYLCPLASGKLDHSLLKERRDNAIPQFLAVAAFPRPMSVSSSNFMMLSIHRKMDRKECKTDSWTTCVVWLIRWGCLWQSIVGNPFCNRCWFAVVKDSKKQCDLCRITLFSMDALFGNSGAMDSTQKVLTAPRFPFHSSSRITVCVVSFGFSGFPSPPIKARFMVWLCFGENECVNNGALG